MIIDRYRWAGGEEAMLRFGPGDGPLVIAAMPLFEEANRTRAFIVRLLRALAARGIRSALPDLPGQGESLTTVETITLEDWRAAFAAAAETLAAPVHVVAIRGGALVDTAAQAASRWHLAPSSGEALVRELLRTRLTNDGREQTIDLSDDGDAGPPLTLAGHRVSRPLLRALHAAEPRSDGAQRTVRLATDQAAADRKVEGAPLWRRSEPGDDPALAETLAADIAAWIRSCDA